MRLKDLVIVVTIATDPIVPLPFEPLARGHTAVAIGVENAVHPLVFWWLAA